MQIDLWTLALQAINFFILIVLLRWLFYSPLLAVIDARRQSVEQELANAATARHEADGLTRSLADQRVALEASREQVMREANAVAERERETALKKTQQEIESALAGAREQITRERRDAKQAVFAEAASLATSLATRLLARAPISDVDLGFVDALLTHVAATPDDQREPWFAAHIAREVTLASAHELDQSAQLCLTDQLKEILGDELIVEFSVDESLIAGGELRFPHGVVALNWAAELANAQSAMRDAAHSIA